MKPDFALNFTDTSIALLHRTAKGWVKVGETDFGAPDMDEALAYLRNTALGMQPGGFATKLVLPPSQILYAEVDAPGPGAAARLGQITAALEELTPYKAEELAFSWSGTGVRVKVAAVARVTLEEAEGFADGYRFNPVAFVAIPEPGQYDGEPWFGTAASVTSGDLAADPVAIALIPAAGIFDDDLSEEELPPQANDPAAAFPEEEALEEIAAEAEAELPLAAPEEDFAAPAEATAAEEAPSEVEPAKAAVAETAPAKADEPAVTPQGELALDAGKSITDAASDEDLSIRDMFPQASWKDEAEAEAKPDPTAAAKPRLEISGIESVRIPVAPATPPKPETPEPPEQPEPEVEAPAARAPLRPDPAPSAPESAKDLAADSDEEAPFAHIPDGAALDDLADLPLPPRAAPTRGAGKAQADLNGLDADEDLPPAPATAVLAAFQSRRKTGETSDRVPPVLAASRSTPPSPAAPLPDSPALDREDEPAEAPRLPEGLVARLAQSKAGDESLSAPPPVSAPRPVQTAAARATAAAQATKGGAKALGGMVTAPSISGAGKRGKQKPQPVAQTASPALSAEESASNLANLPFAGARAADRGKPRFLALILIAILLLCLALVAAWSSLFLASTRGADDGINYATVDSANMPGIDDEALADGEDPEAWADGEAGPVDTAEAPVEQATEAANADPAPETGVDTGIPASVALVDTQDEIFLSGSDAPPPAFDALSLPAPSALAEAAPDTAAPPPPFGTIYRFDSNGLLEPLPQGIASPDGYMIYSGKPPLVPPARSAVADAAAAEARQAAAAPPASAANDPALTPAAPEAAGASPSEGGAVEALPVGVADGTQSAPGSLVPGATITTSPPTQSQPANTVVELGPEAQPNPELVDRRPRIRPADLVTTATDDEAALETETATQTAVATGLRPRARPAIILATAERSAREQSASASLVLPEESAPPAASTEDAANPSLLAISRRPEERPRDLSRAVDAAVAAAIRTPEPTPAAAPAAAAAPRNTGRAAANDEADDEPEVAAAAAPKIPTKANVAKQATFTKAINLSKINLIGVSGTPSKRSALVRMPNGRINKVSIGDRLDGGRVQAITGSELRYQKGGRLISLEMPRG